MTMSTAGSRSELPNDQDAYDIKERNPTVALLLSICPGLGQQYSGHLVRGIVLYIGLVVLSWMAAVAYMYVKSPMVSLLLLSVPFVGVAIIAIDAYISAKRQPRDYHLKWYNGYWIYAGVFITLLLTINPLMDYLVGRNIVRALYVTSESMEPAVLMRDLVVINKLETPIRGDIILVNFGQDSSRKAITKLIKDQVLRRVIAQSGDTVEIKGREVYLNEELLDEPYTSFGEQDSLNPLIDSDFRLAPTLIPEGAYFVLSDARQFGFDSRDFGLVDKSRISGVATKVFWSWNLDQGHFQWDRTAMSLK